MVHLGCESTPWYSVYRRHTNFAIESIEQTFNGAVGFGKRVSCTVSRNGDLVTNMYLELTLKKGSAASYFPAEAFIKDCEIEIGGQKCDKHYAAWYRVFDELTRTGSEKDAYRRMVDFYDSETAGTVKRFYVPLVFWFNRNPGLALPLIALILTGLKSVIPTPKTCAEGGRHQFSGAHDRHFLPQTLVGAY